MRDLQKDPITKKELLEFLDKQKELTDQRHTVGDMRVLYWKEIMHLVDKFCPTRVKTKLDKSHAKKTK